MRSPRSIITLSFVVAATLALSAPAFSQPKAGGADGAQQADEHFRKGKELLKAGDKKGAREEYLAAFRLKKSYDVAGNLGSLELTLGLPREAAEHLSFALRSYAASGTTPEQLEKARQRLGEAERQVGRVKVWVSVDGAEVLVDGKGVGRAPLGEDVFVESGERTIEARLSGYEVAKQTITIAKGQAVPVRLTLAAVPVAVPNASAVPMATGGASASTPPVPTASSTAPVPPPSRSLVPGMVIAGVGVAAIATGIGFLVDAGAKRSTSSELSNSILKMSHSCVAGAGNYDGRCDELSATSRAGTTSHDVGVGMFVGAGVAAAGAATYFLWVRSRSAAPTSDAVHVVPTASLSGAGLVLSGAF